MRNDVDAAASVLGGGKPKEKTGKLKVQEVHIRRGHAGGFIVKHDLEDEGGSPHPKQHVYPLATMEDLRKHFDAHMGEEGGGDAGAKARQNAAARGSASPKIQELD